MRWPIYLMLAVVLMSTAWSAEQGAVLVDAKHPGAWQSDGMWTVTSREDGVELLKDEKPKHNSMCWLTLPEPLRRGQTLEITYRMQVPDKHVDLALVQEGGLKDAGTLPAFAEVISLGGIPSTAWETRRLTVTAPGPLNTLCLLSWGWPVDRGTWMRVASIRVLPAGKDADWFVWRVPLPLTDTAIPARSPLQDFFPFGVYFPMEFGENYQYEGLKDRWEWYDRALADIKARGMNFTSVTNLSAADLDRLAALHAKHGLRMNPQVGEFLIKHQGPGSLKLFTRAVAKYRGNPVIAGWAVGEEFDPADIPLLDLPHEIVHAVDPQNTLVTIHNNSEAFRQSGKQLDIRIAFRDIYPFFADPASGPVGHEASMNYYEDEIDKNQRLLPQGASLWVMPQAQHEYYGNPPKFVFKQPTPAEIGLQTWAALAHGAQGIAYFLYPSAPPAKAGDISPMQGLRLFDGTPTPQIEALTALAKTLVPLGPIIARWQRTRLPAASDQRELRAYLFKGGDGQPYLLALNHDAEHEVTGRVRIPFTSCTATNLASKRKIKVSKDGPATLIPLSLKPGDGVILRLAGKMPEPEELPDAEGIPYVSRRARPDLPLTDLPDGRHLFRYQIDFQQTNGVPAGDTLSEGVQFREWPTLGAKHMNGLYGRELTYLFEMPAAIASLTVLGRYNNHADPLPHDYRISYSLDGKIYKPVVEKQHTGGDFPDITGSVTLPPNTRRVWVSYSLTDNSAIVLKQLDVQMTVAGKGK